MPRELEYYEKKYEKIITRKEQQWNEFARAMYLQMYAKTRIQDPSQLEYRAYPAWSNSRLSAIKEEIIGIKRAIPYKAFSIGSIVHQQILQPHLCDFEDLILAPKLREDINGMVESLRRETGDLTHKELEKQHVWIDEETGEKCKCQIDIREGNFISNGVITDYKTTISTNQKEFLEAVSKWEYDRQAAYYMDGTNAIGFHIIGVQKFKPYRIFKIQFTKTAKPVVEARKRYRFLLKKARDGKHSFFS